MVSSIGPAIVSTLRVITKLNVTIIQPNLRSEPKISTVLSDRHSHFGAAFSGILVADRKSSQLCAYVLIVRSIKRLECPTAYLLSISQWQWISNCAQ